MSKKILAMVCAMLLMVGMLAVPAFASDTDATWQNAYANQVLAIVEKYNAMESEYRCGVQIVLLDVDLDGTPELFAGYLEAGQVSYVAIEEWYNFQDGAAQQIELPEGKVSAGAYLPRAYEMDDRNHFYLLKDPATGDALWVTQTTRNEGTYDFALYFHQILFEDQIVKAAMLKAYELPESIVKNMKSDNEATAYFTEQAKGFLGQYEVLSENVGVSFVLGDTQELGTELSVTYEEIIEKLGTYVAPLTSNG